MTTPERQQATLVTHNDLDGVVCAIVFRAAYPDGAYYLTDYNKVDELIQHVKIVASEPFFIADISPRAEGTAEYLNRLAGYGTPVHLFDHHKTAEHLVKYTWATIDMDDCGAMLFHDYLIMSGRKELTRYNELVWHANDYDMWKHEDPYSRRINSLLQAIGAEKFMERFLERPDVGLTEKEDFLLEITDEQEKRYIQEVCDQWEPSMLAGRSVPIVFADRLQSRIGEHLLEKWDVDMCAVVDVVHKTVSLRARAGTDVSAVAKELGGGGHAGAAGYPLDVQEFRLDLAAELCAGMIRSDVVGSEARHTVID